MEFKVYKKCGVKIIKGKDHILLIVKSSLVSTVPSTYCSNSKYNHKRIEEEATRKEIESEVYLDILLRSCLSNLICMYGNVRVMIL